MEDLTIVGAGRVGTSLALDLAALGRFREVRLVGRSAGAPPAVAGHAELDYRPATSGNGLPAPPLLPDGRSSVVLFCVPDDGLPELAARWGAALERTAARGPRLALHTSGVHSAGALAPLRRLGAAVAGWHPLLALAAPRAGAFRSIAFGVEGDEEAVSWAGDRSHDLGARTLRVRPDAKPLYHAAAVFGSNYLVACLSVAADLLRRSAHGAIDGTAVEALLPLARSALENVGRAGPGAGATGPIVRGDVETVRAHLGALDPVTSALYRALGAALLRSRGAAPSDEALARLREALGGEG